MRGMKLSSALFALLFLCTAAGVCEAQTAGEPKAVPFRISSLGSAFAMQGDFEGEFRVYEEGIEVRLTDGLVRISPHCPYKGRRVFGSIKFALSAAADKGWKMVSASQKFWVERVMLPNDEYQLGPISFWIPKEAGADLSRHWMVVQMDDIALDIPGDEERNGYAFAQSYRDIFVSR
jgi:hypothetical protein